MTGVQTCALPISGYVYGFRFQNGFISAISMIGLILFFTFSFSWIAAFIGMTVKDAETAQLASFVIIFPLTFASAAFVPINSMVSWLQVFARNQPITFAVDAARQLALGLPSTGAVWKLLLWTLGILIVFIPLSIQRYKARV